MTEAELCQLGYLEAKHFQESLNRIIDRWEGCEPPFEPPMQDPMSDQEMEALSQERLDLALLSYDCPDYLD